MRLVIVTTHPIQYQAPLFRALAAKLDLRVVFMMRQTPQGQAAGGFGTEFEWDIPLFDGYEYVFAKNGARMPSSNRRDGIVLTDYERLLSSLNPSVVAVLGWFPRGYLQVIDWARRRGIPLVCRGESNLLSNTSPLQRIAKQFVFRRLFRRFSAFAAIGKLNAELYRHYGVPDAKIADAPYSVNTPFFESGFLQCRPVRRRVGTWRIGFAGKLIAKKRPLDLLRALHSADLVRKIQLVVIGDGPLRSAMEKLASELRIDCEFRGFLNQSEIVREGYADLDALVLPSGEYETWGLVVNEVMTGGIPAIVSDKVGCGPDLIDDDETGYLFRSGDVADLGRRLSQLINRLEAGHSFTKAVKNKIDGHSMDQTVEGFCKAIAIAAR